jgi:hypothetical protein
MLQNPSKSSSNRSYPYLWLAYDCLGHPVLH